MKIMRKQLVEVGTFTAICIIIFAPLAPDVLESLQESRTWMAYSDVGTLYNEHVGDTPDEPAELDELDPWGNAYVIQTVDGNQIRVTSAGPDGVSASSDDIWSGMSTSPMEPFHNYRRWGWIRAFSISIGVWLAFMAAYWWSRATAKRREKAVP